MNTIDDLAVTLLDGSFFMEEAVELLEKCMIVGALLRSEGNQSEASKVLGIHRNTLQRKMAEYKIDGRRKKPVRKPMARASAGKVKRVKKETVA
jgi:DNA-binding NtrC family response regulator